MPQPSDLEKVQRESRERLYPSLTNPNWLVLRRRRQIFEAGLHRLPESGLSVLDIGGRLQPYRLVLGARVKNYIAVDLRVNPLVDISAAAEALPFPDGQFDFVICTQVFEYLPDPRLALAEIKRVLRNGGVLFLSSPAVFLQNNDRECWRFLPEGWRQLLREFSTVEIVPEGNSLTGFFRTCNVFMMSFFKPRFLAPVWQWTLVPFLNISGYVLEGLAGQNTNFTANYSVWARK